MQREVPKKEEERWNVKAIAMNHQSTWTRWENVKESMEMHQIKFLLFCL